MKRLAFVLAVGLLVLVWPHAGPAQVGPANRYHATSVLCTTIETLLVDGNPNRVSLRILNTGTATLYVGGGTLSPGVGFPIHAVGLGQTPNINHNALILQGSEASGGLYCVADASVTVKIFQAIR